MAQILVRDLSPQTLEQLKERARANNRSLEAEVRNILEEVTSVQERKRRAWVRLQEISRSLEGREHSDSTELIREDRDR
jgi:plasmid stability protein